MSKYTWNGSKERDWRIREIVYIFRCLDAGTRTEKEALSRIRDVVYGEARKD